MKTIHANNIQIAYLDLGSGPPLVLLHGFSLDHSMWAAQAKLLQRKYRLISPDLRGAGKTENPAEPFFIETMAEDAAALLEALDIESAAVAGFSMGGLILANMLVRHPLKVRAAAFISTLGTGADGPERQEARLKNIRFVMEEGSEAFAFSFVPRLFSPAFINSYPDEVAQTQRIIGGQRPKSLALMLDAMRQRRDLSLHLKDFVVPSVVVIGNEDAIVPVAAMRALHEGMPKSVFEIIDGAGHMTTVEAPEKVASLLDQLMQRVGV